MMTIALLVIAVMIMSRGLKKRSISLERTFILNLRSRDIDAQVKGRKKPLFVGRLLDRDLHIGNLEIPEDSNWAGKSLRELQLRKLFGVHVSSILRGRQRINIPNGHTILFPGDRIEAIGDDEQLSKLDNAIKTDLVPEDTDIEKREMKLRQMIISGNSEFVGKTLKDSGIRDKYNCMVVGVENGQERLTAINPNWILEKGNVLWIVGEEENLKALIG
jgi:CPA2 family monovalent cation:H+ antiporter-2